MRNDLTSGRMAVCFLHFSSYQSFFSFLGRQLAVFLMSSSIAQKLASRGPRVARTVKVAKPWLLGTIIFRYSPFLFFKANAASAKPHFQSLTQWLRAWLVPFLSGGTLPAFFSSSLPSSRLLFFSRFFGWWSAWFYWWSWWLTSNRWSFLIRR